MTNEYARWMREREAAQRAAQGIRIEPQRATLEGDVVVPVLQAAAIGLAAGLAVGVGVLLIGFGREGWARWGLAGQVAGCGCVAALAVCTVVFIIEHRRTIRDPLDISWERLDMLRPRGGTPPPAMDEAPWRVVRGFTPSLPAQVETTVQAIEPEARPEIRELYEFIAAAWPVGSVSRASCRNLGFGRAQWERLVGGVRGREGQESARGLLDRAGVVRRTRSGWEICAGLQDALAINAELLAYAEAKSSLVQLGREGADGMGRPGGAARTAQAREGRGI